MRTATPVNFTLDLNGRSRPPVQPGGARADRRHRPRPGPRRRPAAVHPDPGRDVRPGPDRRRGRLRGAHRGRVPGRPSGRLHLRRAWRRRGRAGRRVRRLRCRPPAPAAPRPASPITYDLRPGLADPGLISERDWTRAMRLAASPTRSRRHQTCAISSAAHLRRARGLAVDPEDIFLFPSVSNALRAVAVTCGLAGQPVAFEDPGYAKARLALREAGAVIRPVPVDDDGIKAPGPAGQRPGLLRHAGPPVPAGRPDAGAPPGRPAGLGHGRRRARAGRRLRRRVPLRRAPAEPAAQHARRRRSRGLPGHQLEDPVPRAAGVLGRAARPVPRRDGRPTWTPPARRSARSRPRSWPASSPPAR